MLEWHWTRTKCQFNLRGCYISKKFPPWNVLMDSKRKFSHIAIDNKTEFESDSLCAEFFNAIVDDITSMEISRTPLSLPWCHLTKMKKLVLGAFRYIVNIEIPNTVEHIHVHRTGHFISKGEWEKFNTLTHLKILTLDSIDMNVGQKSSTLRKVFQRISEINGGYTSVNVDAKFNLLERPLEAGNVTGVNICYTDLEGSIENFAAEFAHLEAIELTTNEIGCLWTHDMSNVMEKVTTMLLTISSTLCQDCLLILPTIFPNVNTLTFEDCEIKDALHVIQLYVPRFNLTYIF